MKGEENKCGSWRFAFIKCPLLKLDLVLSAALFGSFGYNRGQRVVSLQRRGGPSEAIV